MFRHQRNQKWFGLLIEVASDKIGLESPETVLLLTVKQEPEIIELLLRQPTYYPAYHMNKTNWISMRLDSCTLKQVTDALEDSFQLTR